MATKMKVTYTDGRVIELLASARAQVETERHFKSFDNAQSQRIESSFYLAWASLRQAGKETADFEDFLNVLADAEVVDPNEADEKATDPTPAAASSTGSSD
jgi:hypothetical protein